MGRRSHEDWEKMAESGDKEAQEYILNHRISNHSEVRKIKVYFRKMFTGVCIFFAALIIFVIWFTFSGNTKKIVNMKMDAERYSMLRNPVEYQILEHDINAMTKGLRVLSYKYTRQSASIMNAKQTAAVVSLLCFYKFKYNIDPYFPLAIIATESEFDPTKISYGQNGEPIAYGLMQLLPPTFKEMNGRLSKYYDLDIMDVGANVDAGLYYIFDTDQRLRRELKKDSLSYRQMACAYNGGFMRAYRAIKANQYDNDNLPQETVDYMVKVIFYYTNYIAGNFNCWAYEASYLGKTNK